MHFNLRNLLPFLPLTTSTVLPSPQHIFSNSPPSPDFDSFATYKIPTSYESAILARRILNLTPLGTLSTVFPSPNCSSNDRTSLEQRPSGISGAPIGLMDYIADCDSSTPGNPTILSITIATSFKNVASGSNISLSLRWTPPYPPKSRISSSFFSSKKEKNTQTTYSAANLPRFSLIGYLEPILEQQVEEGGIEKCFTNVHPDSKYWLPGNKIHRSEWVRLVVQHVYWIGGFGDRAYIGWIPVEEWNGVSKEEWEGARLPGEKKGWREWGVDLLEELGV